MRPVYRDKDNYDYWESRWSAAGVDEQEFESLDIYPIKYAEMAIKDSKRVLEAGCGAGRLYFHYKRQGKEITGIDFSSAAIEAIRQADPNADVRVADILELPFCDGSFDLVLAFGLYHNLSSPESIHQAFSETARVLAPGGVLMASVRCDNIENNLIERIQRKKKPNADHTKFHRMHFTEQDIEGLLHDNGMTLHKRYFVRNVSFLFRFDWLRHSSCRKDRFVESEARSKGFRLNRIGAALDTLLHAIAPRQFSNLIVFQAIKT